MKSMEVNIALDPVNDGASIININVEKKDIGSLIIATNGERKIASLAENGYLILSGETKIHTYNKDRLLED